MDSQSDDAGGGVDYFLPLNEDCKRLILSYLPPDETIVQVMQMHEQGESRLLFYLGRYLLNQEEHYDCSTLWTAAMKGYTGLVKTLCSFPDIKLSSRGRPRMYYHRGPPLLAGKLSFSSLLLSFFSCRMTVLTLLLNLIVISLPPCISDRPRAYRNSSHINQSRCPCRLYSWLRLRGRANYYI